MSSPNFPSTQETFWHQGLPSPLHTPVSDMQGAFSNTSTASPPAFMTSPNGMIHVHGYMPAEGEQGVPITTHIDFNDKYHQAVYVRLVVGQTPIATRVREVFESPLGRWQLEGAVPTFAGQRSASAKVEVSVQALSSDNVVLDSCTFGEFTYWESECTCAQPCRSLRSHQEKVVAEDSQATHLDRRTQRRTQRRTHLPAPSPIFANRVLPAKTARQRMGKLRRCRTKGQSLRRAMSSAPGVFGILTFVTPLESLCRDLDKSELNAGRRLVRFSSVRQGHMLKVSCERITQEEYNPADTVISCIYREDVNNCFVTSVDIIYLLERLVDEEFAVEEKNRIRRNLEVLHPTTISKHKFAVQDFFHCIMKFPDPKPRNIEKDLKVFEWRLLGQALAKIISKYALVDEPAESGTSCSSSSSSLTLEGQLPGEEQLDSKPAFAEVSVEPTSLMYPGSSDDGFTSAYADPTLCDSPAETLFIPSDAYYAPTVPSFPPEAHSPPTFPARPYFFDPTDLCNSQESSSNSGSWGSEVSMGTHDFISDVVFPQNCNLDTIELQVLKEHNLASTGSDFFM